MTIKEKQVTNPHEPGPPLGAKKDIMKLIDGQIMCIFSQVLYRHAEIVSGAYKLRGVQKGCGKNNDGTISFRPLTEAELLEDSMRIMKAQIRQLNEFTEAIQGEDGHMNLLSSE